LFRLNDRFVYRADSLDQFSWLEHGFGTRLSNGWPDMSRVVTPKQVHSDIVLPVPGDPPTGPTSRMGTGDALVSNHPRLLAGIRTADCIPILLVDARHRHFGAIHAGWRGTTQGIARKAVDAMMGQFGTQPDDIWAAIGPGIGACCFEVGPEVAVQFESIFPEAGDMNRRMKLDLGEANRRQLLSAGIPEGQIEVSGLCTVCLEEEFHSYRRDREKAGRMLSVIGPRKH
jgi:YfiH family protein